MKITSIINGTIQLVLTPENDLEKEIVKQLNGAAATLVSSNNSILNNSIEGSLLLRMTEKNAGGKGD